ncbi:hypothetical protein BCL67_10997 [Nesterenkonia sandarakina]|uniref:Uncharacterized protein n=1 Tax=Nesterenkonia sandarakina TaxID=272918 RepID=A0A2T0YIZ2_9MICC|nr:hypothetical protein BCL67_10997 [Nesterenkonia sandarakina]
MRPPSAPVAAQRRRLFLWAPALLVGVALLFTGHYGAAMLGIFIASAIGGPGLILDRPHPTHA